MAYAFRQPTFRENRDNLLAGVVVGLVVVSAWFTTGYLGQDEFDPVTVESLSFIAPAGNTINYLMTFTGATINFGIASVLGMVLGAFVHAILTGSFRIETFSNRGDMISHLVGAVLMGIGGVLALGCTVGQGIAGVSTLATGAIIAVLSIVLGCALTIKTQYHLLDEEPLARAIAYSLGELLWLRRAPDDQ